ncbi:MAG: class I SAM-dependent methyltransferase [Candidatus Eremiobacteraeota bacterium]|nr:class I SAM-dependent methyltransferase [Candidatus Eremiobacteraeota bacterium]
MSDQTQSTRRFGDRAEAYAAFRPDYPEEAADAVLEGLGDPGTLNVADVGAGTGISARLFANRGAYVYAIEPNADMRQAASEHPNIEWVDGTADKTGLPDLSVDVVVACQAFHWFANPFVMAEFRRISRSRAAMMQYERDERDPFTKAYGDVVRAHARDDTEATRMQALATFGHFPKAKVKRSAFTSTQTLDLEGVIGRASSSSYLPNSGPEAVSLRRDLRSVFETFEQLGKVEFAMVTFVLIADFI